MRILLMAVSLGLKDEEIGLAYISSGLKELGYECLLLSYNYKEIDYDTIQDYAPDLIGICLYSHMVSFVNLVVSKCKSILTDVQIAVGGYFPTYCYKEVLESSIHLDYVVIGNGETSFINLVQAISNNESTLDLINVAQLKNGQVWAKLEKTKFNPDFIQLLPDRNVLKVNDFNCAKIHFSRRSMFYPDQVFYRDKDEIVSEIKSIYNEYHVNRYDILDGGLKTVEDLSLYRDVFKTLRQEIEVFYYLNISGGFEDYSDEVIEELINHGLVGIHVDMIYNSVEFCKIEYKLFLKKCQCFFDRCRQFQLAPSVYFRFLSYAYPFEVLYQNLAFLNEHGLALEVYMDTLNKPLKNTEEYIRYKEKSRVIIDDKKPFYNYIIFVDDRVREFYNFLEYIVNKYYDNGILDSMYQYTIEFSNLVGYYMRNSFGEQIDRLVIKFKEEIKCAVEKWSSTRKECYTKILNVFESKDSIKQKRVISESIFNQYIEIETMKEDIKVLEKLRIKMFKRMLLTLDDKMI